MPAIRTIHNSNFNINGLIYKIYPKSSALPRMVDQSAAIGAGIFAGSSIPNTTLSFERHLVFHQSEFGMLQERPVNIDGSTIPRSDVGIAISQELLLSGLVVPSSVVSLSTNALYGRGYAIPASNITARYVVPDDRKIRFGAYEFMSAERKQADSIVPMINTKMSNAGIHEPRAYSTSVIIAAESNDRMDYYNLKSQLGKKYVLSVYGVAYPNAHISNLSDLQFKPGLNRWEWDVEFTSHVFDTNDSVTFGPITLSNPTIPNPFDINPSYSVDMLGVVDDALPRISKHYAVEALTEDPSEFEALVNAIGARLTLIINGNEYVLCYISSLSALQPRGGGNVWGYTIEFSQETNIRPVTVVYDGRTLPNCTYGKSATFEIIQSRTEIHTGQTAADISPYAARSFAFNCLSNDKTEYEELINRIAEKKTLVVDGESFTKMYISELSDTRIIGDGATRLYQWSVGFEQETI